MSAADYNILLLALTMYREARGEGEAGMLAVGHVIANRCFTWSKTYHDVILGHNQFTSMTVEGDSQTVEWPALGDPVFDLADSVYSGFSKDNTGGALYYWNPETADQHGWFAQNIANTLAHPMTVKIGHHEFYK